MKKRTVSWLLSLALLLSLMAIPLSGTADVRTEMEIVGEWIWSSTINDAGPDGAERIFSRSAEMGVTDIYLLVKGTAGKVYFQNTDVALAKAYEERDILQEAIDAAHAHGIRLHAWITSIEDGVYKEAYPESGLYHYKNGKTNNRVHPADPGFNEYMRNLVAELAANYDVDGLHFDYIRYNHMTNGWAQEDLDAMAAMGANVERLKELIETTLYIENPDANYIFDQYKAGDPDAQIFVQYRRQNVVNFATGIIDAARAVNPDIIISAAIMPDGATDPAFHNVHYGQDYGDAAALYDYIIPMAYAKDYGHDAAWVADVVKACVEKGNIVVAGLQAYSPAKSEDLVSEVEAVRALMEDPAYAGKVLGVANFRVSQYSYAKLTYTENKDTLDVKVYNVSVDNPFTWVEVKLQDGLTVASAKVVSGFDGEALVEISQDGNAVKFARNVKKLLAKDSAGELQIVFEGQADPAQPIARVQTCISSESRTYHVYDVIAE